MVIYINSSIVNNILYAIWYDILNIANNGTAKYGNIQKSRTTVNSSIVNNILYAIWYDMLNIANIMYCTLPYCVLYYIIWFATILQFPNRLIFSFVVMICVGVILSILYCWFDDTVGLLQKWYQTINHNEMNHHGDSRALQRMKNAANQRKRCQDPTRREAEQVADTARQHIAREEPGRREEEQEANTA